MPTLGAVAKDKEFIHIQRDFEAMISCRSRFILVVFLALMPAFGHSETMNELVKRDGLFFRKFVDVTYTGSINGIA